MKKTLYLFLSMYSMSINADSLKHVVLEENSFGIELNPIRLFVYHDSEESLSGTFSYFDKKNSVEIAIPWMYYKEDNYRNYGNDIIPPATVQEKSILIDLHYRKYFTPNTEGAYIGTFGRYAHLEGRARKMGKNAIVDKFGLGVEVGFKVKNIMNSPFYYGASLAVGSYFGGDNDVFDTNNFIDLDTFEIDDRKTIFEIELLKIGYEF